MTATTPSLPTRREPLSVQPKPASYVVTLLFTVLLSTNNSYTAGHCVARSTLGQTKSTRHSPDFHAGRDLSIAVSRTIPHSQIPFAHPCSIIRESSNALESPTWRHFFSVEDLARGEQQSLPGRIFDAACHSRIFPVQLSTAYQGTPLSCRPTRSTHPRQRPQVSFHGN